MLMGRPWLYIGWSCIILDRACMVLWMVVERKEQTKLINLHQNIALKLTHKNNLQALTYPCWFPKTTTMHLFSQCTFKEV